MAGFAGLALSCEQGERPCLTARDRESGEVDKASALKRLFICKLASDYVRK